MISVCPPRKGKRRKNLNPAYQSYSLFQTLKVLPGDAAALNLQGFNRIENNSNDTIVAFRVLEPGYRDTIPPPTKPGNVRSLQPHTISSFTSQVPYEEIFKKLDRDTMSFYFYKYHIFSTMAWDEVRENRMFLMRYELSLEDLKKLSFRVPYPPTEAMADMKVVLP